MDNERIMSMTDNVMDGISVVSNVRTAAVSEDEDVALSNVDQALDTMLMSIGVIMENLPKIKTDSVPEKASVDAISDLMNTAISPYFADILKYMAIFGV